LKKFLTSNVDLGPLAPLRGFLFEPFAHNRLRIGGWFEVKCLEGKKCGKISEVYLLATTLKTLNSLDDIAALLPTEYGLPKSKIFEAVDSIRKSSTGKNMIFRMTDSNSITIKTNELDLILRQLNNVAKLYFGVPTDVYSNFKAQTYSTEIGNIPANVRKVVQYALKIN
jgi:hypothetical protein